MRNETKQHVNKHNSTVPVNNYKASLVPLAALETYLAVAVNVLAVSDIVTVCSHDYYNINYNCLLLIVNR